MRVGGLCEGGMAGRARRGAAVAGTGGRALSMQERGATAPKQQGWRVGRELKGPRERGQLGW